MDDARSVERMFLVIVRVHVRTSFGSDQEKPGEGERGSKGHVLTES